MIDLTAKRRHTQTMLDRAELLFDQGQYRIALQRIADEVTRDLSDEYPLLLSVMSGAVVFAGQLLPLLHLPLDFDYIRVSRYDDELAGNAFNWKRMPDPEQIKDRHAVVLDDTLGEGHTMAAIQEKLRGMGVASCRMTMFANKLIGKERPTEADYVRLDVPNHYVFGYGTDAAGCQCNLDEIYVPNQDWTESL